MGKTEILIEESVGFQKESMTGMKGMAIGTKSKDEHNRKVMYADVVKNGNDVMKVRESSFNHTPGIDKKIRYLSKE